MRVLALILLLVAPPAAAECECLWHGSFAEVQSRADLVLAGSVVSGKGNSIDLAPQRILRGAHPPGNIRIWLKTGDYCRPDAEMFPAGSQWVMALHQINEEVPGGFNPATPNVSYGRVGDYRLSACGGYWLRQSGDVVTGNLVDAPRWDREPKMTPVHVDLLAAYVRGEIPREHLAEAAREDPALRELMLDTRAFLRDEN